MEAFRWTLEATCLLDLGWTGNKFTWSNGHEGITFIKERLDRVVANHAWVNMFQEVGVEVLGTWVLDQKPLFLDAKGRGDRQYKRRIFRYEMSWGYGR